MNILYSILYYLFIKLTTEIVQDFVAKIAAFIVQISEFYKMIQSSPLLPIIIVSYFDVILLSYNEI